MRISHLRRNVEIKARDPDPARSRTVCAELEAADQGVLSQRDTYFRVPHGRLKLREEGPLPAQLIAYERPDMTSERTSEYRLVEVNQPEQLRQTLAAALGTEVVVNKRRQLFLWQGVRIHLDQVDGLGSFIEFEAVAQPESDLSREAKQVRALRSAFSIDEASLVAQSYCDLQIGR